MKGRLAALLGVFCIAVLVVSAVNAGKPQNPGTPTDLIIFMGDLEGHAIVEECCPNAGPNPPYTMTVTRDLGSDGGPQVHAGTYDGFIFMNVFGTKKNQQYYVKFWGVQDELPISIAVGIKGGIIYQEKKSDVLFVDFDGDILYTLDEFGVLDEPIEAVYFTLERTEL